MQLEIPTADSRSSPESDKRLGTLESVHGIYKTPTGWVAILGMVVSLYLGYQQYTKGQQPADPETAALYKVIKAIQDGQKEPAKQPTLTPEQIKALLDALKSQQPPAPANAPPKQIGGVTVEAANRIMRAAFEDFDKQFDKEIESFKQKQLQRIQDK